MATIDSQVVPDLELRVRRLMDALELAVTAEEAQKLDVHRYLVTHLKDYGLWLDEVRRVCVEEGISIPLPLYQEIIQIGLEMDVDPEYWRRIFVRPAAQAKVE